METSICTTPAETFSATAANVSPSAFAELAGTSPVNDFFANLAVTCIAYDPSNTLTIYFGNGEGWLNTEGVRGDGIFKSTDGGVTWTQLVSTTGNASFQYIQKIAVATNGDVYAGTIAGLQKSTDGGLTWTQVLEAGNGSVSSAIAILKLQLMATSTFLAESILKMGFTNLIREMWAPSQK